MTSVVFTHVSSAVNAHGGHVESVSAEAMNAVFGVPEVHEDDALRAARAAVEIHEQLANVVREQLDGRGAAVEVQVGISTGEVVVGGASQPPLLVTGAPFITAERLAQAAAPGATLLDEATVRRVAKVVDGESSMLAGSAVFRLTGLRESAADEPRFSAPMVGREREQRRLLDAYEQAVADRSCQLFTILGAAGVGKSRLVQEFLEELDGNGEARVARGRCLPYGEGITFWPVHAAVRELVDVDESGGETTAAQIAALIPDAEGAQRIAEHVSELIGAAQTTITADERTSALQRLVEELGRRTPFILVFDDIHWGEETFLDLVEHLADWCRDTTVLLLCMARPELLDLRPTWGGGKLNATSVLLEPLSEDDCDQLVDHLLGGAELPPGLRGRITQAAEGNPLFVEEMAAMLVDDGLLERRGSRWVATADLTTVPVPPTISGLLAARLDRLPHSEREAIERAAVEGKVFHRSSVEALSPASEDASVSAALGALVRKELIRRNRPDVPGEEAYRFRHLLIRDAAYDSVPKQLRADLHERHAAWLEEKVGAHTAEYDEIVGYHLEQAYHYRIELGPIDDAATRVGRRAAERLGAAGRRALLRSDAPAGTKLFARAVDMLAADDALRVELIPNVRAVQGLADLTWADRVLTEAIEAAATTGDRNRAAHALVQRGLLRLFSDAAVTPRELLGVSERTNAAFEETGDELGLARSWRLAAQAHYLDRQAARSAAASERALVHVRRAGDRFELREIVEWLVIALLLGPEPGREAIPRCESLLAEARDDLLLESQILSALAVLYAMQARADEADAALERGSRLMEDAGEQVWIASYWRSMVYVWRSDPDAAEQELRPAYDALKGIGERSHFTSLAHGLSDALYLQGRYDETELLTRECEEACRPNDVHSHILWRSIRAKVLARRGEYDAALRLAQESNALAAESDFLPARAGAMEDLSKVLYMAGRTDEARPVLAESVELFERKGNLLAAERARALLESDTRGD